MPRLLSEIVAFNTFPSHIVFQGISPGNEVGEEKRKFCSSIRGLTGPLPIKIEYFLNGLIRELDFEHMTNKMADLIFNEETLCMHAQIRTFNNHARQ